LSGIGGILEFGGGRISSRALSAMSEALATRGPGKETVFLDGRDVGLFHRFLSVSARDPGTVLDEGNVWVAVDGALHNLPQLQREWGHGDRFSMAETVIEAYRSFGLDFAAKLEGAFAFVLFDKVRKRLILARDKMGIKPLYYGLDNHRLVFGSEIRAILRSGYITPGLNHRAVADYLSFQFVLGRKTFFEGIESLDPATLWIWEDGRSEKRRYWHFACHGVERPDADYIRETREALSEAVRAVDTDGNKAGHLSGGLDSSIICALLSQGNGGLETFSIVYPYGEGYDESRYANSLSKKIESRHTSIYPSAGDVEGLLPQMVRDLQEPVSDVAFSRYFLAKRIKEMRQETRVVYCGQGADELFGGYAFYLDYLAHRFKGPLFLQSYQRRRLFSRDWLKRLLAEEFYDKVFGSYRVLEAYEKAFEHPGNFLDAASQGDIALFLPYWLQVEDRINAAFSMEVRYPFLYHKVAALAACLPLEMKIRGKETKYALREAFRDLLPPDVTAHKKVGLRTPSGIWFREDLYDFAKAVLLGERARNRGIFRSVLVQEMLDNNRSGEANLGWQIWTLILLELWQREYLDRWKMD